MSKLNILIIVFCSFVFLVLGIFIGRGTVKVENKAIKPQYYDRALRSYAGSLENALGTSQAIYIAQEKKKPTVFRDFVTMTNKQAELTSATMALEGFLGYIDNVEGLNSNTLTITFNNKNVAIYTLLEEGVNLEFIEKESEEKKVL